MNLDFLVANNFKKGFIMKEKFITGSIVIALMFGSSVANAKGCLKGAAVGGVAGHVAGHHGLLGATAGCVIGRHRANKAEREENARQNNVTNRGVNSDLNTTSRKSN